MAQSHAYGVLLVVAFAAANLPWLSGRFLLLVKLHKTAGWRWLEWLVCYGLAVLSVTAMEDKFAGEVYDRQREFYVATLCLFMVFALPGFIYHYDLKKLLNP